MIIPIKHKFGWELIIQINQAQSNKYIIRENNKRVDHKYKVGDKVILNNSASYKYKNPYKVPLVTKRRWINGTVTLQCGAIKIGHNIRQINPYTYDKNVEDINPENMCDDFNI